MQPTKIEQWAVVNFSARCDIRGLVRDLIKCGGMKGIVSSIVASCILTEKHNRAADLSGIIDFGSPLKTHLMYLKKILSLGVLHQWLEWRRCLKRSSLSFLGPLSSSFVCFLSGKTLIFMVGDVISLEWFSYSFV